MSERIEAALPLVTREGFPRGLGCLECGRRLPEGSPSSERFVKVWEGEYVGALVFP